MEHGHRKVLATGQIIGECSAALSVLDWQQPSKDLDLSQPALLPEILTGDVLHASSDPLPKLPVM